MDAKLIIDNDHDLWVAKRKAHARFDVLWQGDEKPTRMRLLAYQWLGYQLGDIATIIDGRSGRCHISRMNVRGCEKVTEMMTNLEVEFKTLEGMRNEVVTWNLTQRPEYLKSITVLHFASNLYDQYFIPEMQEARESPMAPSLSAAVPKNYFMVAEADCTALKALLLDPAQVSSELLNVIDDVLVEKSAYTYLEVFDLDLPTKINEIVNSEILLNRLAYYRFYQQGQSNEPKVNQPPKQVTVEASTNSEKGQKKKKKGKKKSTTSTSTSKHQQEKEHQAEQRAWELKVREKHRKAETFRETVSRSLLLDQIKEVIEEAKPDKNDQEEKRKDLTRKHLRKNLSELESCLTELEQQPQTDILRIEIAAIHDLIGMREDQQQKDYIKRQLIQKKQQKLQEEEQQVEKYKMQREIARVLTEITQLLFPETTHRWYVRSEKGLILSPWFSYSLYFDLQSLTHDVCDSSILHIIKELFDTVGNQTITIRYQGVGKRKQVGFTLLASQQLLDLVTQQLTRLNAEKQNNSDEFERRFTFTYIYVNARGAEEYSMATCLKDLTPWQCHEFMNHHRERLRKNGLALIYEIEKGKLSFHGKHDEKQLKLAESLFHRAFACDSRFNHFVRSSYTGAVIFIMNYDKVVGDDYSQDELKANLNPENAYVTRKFSAQSLPTIFNPASLKINQIHMEISALLRGLLIDKQHNDKAMHTLLRAAHLGSVQAYLILIAYTQDNMNPSFVRNLLPVQAIVTEESKLLVRASWYAKALYRMLKPYSELLLNEEALTRYETDAQMLTQAQYVDQTAEYFCVNYKIIHQEALVDFLFRLTNDDAKKRFDAPKIPPNELSVLFLKFGQRYINTRVEFLEIYALKYFLMARSCLHQIAILPNSVDAKLLQSIDQHIIDCIKQLVTSLENKSPNKSILMFRSLMYSYGPEAAWQLSNVPNIRQSLPFELDELRQPHSQSPAALKLLNDILQGNESAIPLFITKLRQLSTDPQTIINEPKPSATTKRTEQNPPAQQPLRGGFFTVKTRTAPTTEKAIQTNKGDDPKPPLPPPPQPP